MSTVTVSVSSCVCLSGSGSGYGTLQEPVLAILATELGERLLESHLYKLGIVMVDLCLLAPQPVIKFD